MKVLFVCTGNTCRSCMAEVIFNSICDKNLQAFSAGIAAVPQSRTSGNAVALIKKNHGIDFSDRYALQLTPDILRGADYVFTMTSRIRDILRDAYPEFSQKIYTLNEYVGVSGDIMDPYGGSIAVYEKTYNMLKNRIHDLLDKFKEDISI